MLGLVSPIPSPVFAETTLSGTQTYSQDGSGYDFAIGGMPFSSAASREQPIIRQSAQVRKEQTDTSREPGEHSLAFWWLKAQSSFHGGAGQAYLGSADTDNEGISRYRYAMSEGVDVFSDPGSVSLLPQTLRVVDTPGITPLIAATDQGYLYVASGNALTRRYMAPLVGAPDHPASSMSFYSTAVAWGGTDPILSLATDGQSYFLATENGIWAGTGAAAATKIYNLPAGSAPLLRYVKQRLILALNGLSGPAPVYELDPLAVAGSALPTAVFSATTGWHWTTITETPSAVLIAGHNYGRSAVYKMTLDTSGPVPVLAPGVVSVEMPPAELVTGLASYLGTVIGVQTTKGFRVGVLADNGDFTYGPLLFEHAWKTPNAGVFGHGNSLYVGYTNTAGVAGLARVDLTNTIGSGQSLRFPWAPDLRAYLSGTYYSGHVSEATIWDYERKAFVVPGVGVFVQSHARVSSGSITTSRIRWDTLEPKLVRFARFRGQGSTGTITLDLGKDSDSSFTSIGSVSLGQRSDSGDLYVPLDSGQFFTVRITLTSGATFSGYQLKALPAQRKQRIIVLPLACYDREVNNSGQIGGGEGSAMARILALESLEQTGSVATLQWLSVYPEQQLSEQVIVEGMEFHQTSAASDRYGWGGVVNLTLRTVD